MKFTFDFWVKNLKENDIIEFNNHDNLCLRYCVQHNYKDIWIANEKNHRPPYTKTINWNEVLNIYTKEDNPEYFL